MVYLGHAIIVSKKTNNPLLIFNTGEEFKNGHGFSVNTYFGDPSLPVPEMKVGTPVDVDFNGFKQIKRIRVLNDG